MDQLNFHKLAKDIILAYAQEPTPEGVEAETLIDEANGRYSLFYVGWQKARRIYGPVIHFDVKDDKIWVQFDGTEDGIANELLEAGVPESSIVLAWQDPYVRQFTPFAVA